jgi:hypothetical protein
VSIGVASAPAAGGSGDDSAPPPTIVGWRALFDSADLNLFSAKRSGRNRVRAPGSSVADEVTGQRPAASSDNRVDTIGDGA